MAPTKPAAEGGNLANPLGLGWDESGRRVKTGRITKAAPGHIDAPVTIDDSSDGESDSAVPTTKAMGKKPVKVTKVAGKRKTPARRPLPATKRTPAGPGIHLLPACAGCKKAKTKCNRRSACERCIRAGIASECHGGDTGPGGRSKTACTRCHKSKAACVWKVTCARCDKKGVECELPPPKEKKASAAGGAAKARAVEALQREESPLESPRSPIDDEDEEDWVGEI
ncbi:hypothetical protein VTJ49DRAFT_5033 [Mycothermus thermophilus]|uniref:Zn(2)-C6 fungal-type domain-containing protein n=1 Tax=Humicola insolens TaxID=85995 RepID=A0ABR3V547_HUMIN